MNVKWSNDADKVVREFSEAIRMTVEYVGTDTLPPHEGWSWYAVLKKYAPATAFMMKQEYDEKNNAKKEPGPEEYIVTDPRLIPKDNDPVNHPSHYTQYKGLEVIDLVEQMNFNSGNVVKYVARAGFKDRDKHIQDLEKAKWYLEREIERVSFESGWGNPEKMVGDG